MDSNTVITGAGTKREGGKHWPSLASVRSGANDLLHWWWQALSDMVPSGWRYWTQPALRVQAGLNELRIYNSSDQHPIDRLDMSDDTSDNVSRNTPLTRGELLIENQLGLVTSLMLPAAAEANIRNVVGFSMDRYTPFREEEVYFDLKITQRDRANDRIEVMIYVIQRAILEKIIKRLEAAGIEVVSADIMDSCQDEVKPLGANLLPARSNTFSVYQTRINSVLLLTSLALLMAVVAIPLYQRHQEVNILERELQALRQAVQEAEKLRDDVNRRSETLRIILQRRNASPPFLELLRELTRLTPDEAWAGQVEIKSGRLRITGEAAAGSELLQALTASDFFIDPRFEAPLTQNPKSGRERFVISLAIRGQNNEP